MNPVLAEVLGVTMRWVHITSVIVLLGGFFYARFTVGPNAELQPTLVSRFRAQLFGAMAALLVSGLYNFVMKPAYPPGYHMWFGIKMLLVLHVFAVSILYTGSNATLEKRMRWMSGIVIAGMAIVGISAYLRWISLTPTVRLP